MIMSAKHFTEIEGREAIERLANGLNIFDEYGQEFEIDFKAQDYRFKSNDDDFIYGTEVLDTHKLNLTDLMKKTWYVRKPFNVRAEMLARPDEWVGAFKNDYGHWFFVGIDTKYFKAICKQCNSNASVNFNNSGIGLPNDEHLDRCIPIEDVPEEELA